MKKFLASINLCSRFLGSDVILAIINTPVMLENKILILANLSSRV